jgi:hypothetical protein
MKPAEDKNTQPRKSRAKKKVSGGIKNVHEHNFNISSEREEDFILEGRELASNKGHAKIEAVRTHNNYGNSMADIQPGSIARDYFNQPN